MFVFLNQTFISLRHKLTRLSHLTLKQLVVGDHQLLFIRRLGDIFYVSQQFVLRKELQDNNYIIMLRRAES